MASRPERYEVDERFSMTVSELVRLIAALPRERREALAAELQRQGIVTPAKDGSRDDGIRKDYYRNNDSDGR